MILLPYYVRRVQAAAGAAGGGPVATIKHYYNGTWYLQFIGTVGYSVTIYPGNGNAPSVVEMTGGVKLWSDSYDGSGHTVTITGAVDKIVRIDLPTRAISQVDFSDLTALEHLWIYNTAGLGANAFSDLSTIRLSVLEYLDVRINTIQDISVLAGALLLQELQADYNYIADVSPIAQLPLLTTIDLNHNKVVYPESSLTWAKKTEGTYNFSYTGTLAGWATVVRQPDRWLNDLADAGWDNSTGANSVDIRYTHPVTALSDAARATLAGNGVTVQFDIKDFMIVNGDSNTANPVSYHSWVYFLDNATWNAGHLENLAVSGKNAYEIDSEFDTKDAYYTAPSGQAGYYFVMAGTNDLCFAPLQTTEELIATLTSIYAKAAVIYDSVCAIHILPSFLNDGQDAAREIQRLAVNAYIDTDPNVDVVVPVPALLSDPEDPTYYSDGIHLTTPVGQQILAAAVETAMGW